MSTHQMHQVEALCDRILLINDGHNVLYGDLDGIRRQHSGHAVLVRALGELPALSGVDSIAHHNGSVKLTLSEQTTPQVILHTLVTQGVVLEQFEIAVPTLDEIFIRVVGAA
jgi:ABC-2 type transport system ATP-binding protein